MPSRKKILVPIELEGWQRTLEVASELGRALEAELVLLHVIRPLVNVYPDLPATLFAQVTKEVEAASREAMRAIAGSSGVRVEVDVGDPVTRILEAVKNEQATMVVIGTHGRRGLARVLLGSVAERVLRQCAVPVVTVRPATAD
jgi:nucleotide-binding universal stress UspA family protein